MQYPNFNSPEKSKPIAKIIPLKIKRKDVALEYLLLSFEKINDTIEEHLNEDAFSKNNSNE